MVDLYHGTALVRGMSAPGGLTGVTAVSVGVGLGVVVDIAGCGGGEML